MKTNAVPILEAAKIFFELRSYVVNLDDLSAKSVARKVQLPIGQVYKTLVCRGERVGVVFAVVAVDGEIDLKVLARSANDRSCQTVSLKNARHDHLGLLGPHRQRQGLFQLPTWSVRP